MKLEKKDTDIFLALWIKNDPELWCELRNIHVQLLIDRIIEEKSYRELAMKHRTTPTRIKEVFMAILHRIDRNISSDIAKHLRTINNKISAKPEKPFTVFEVALN